MLDSIAFQNIYLVIAVSVFSFTTSIIFDNYSVIDRLWSILPPTYVGICLYNLYISVSSQITLDQFVLKFQKPILLFFLALVWGARLTYNFARKGGYSLSSEDYRWNYLRHKKLKNEFLFQLLNFFFISIFQSIILYLLAHPYYLLSVSAIQQCSSLSTCSSRLSVADCGLVFIFAALLLIESIADNQQWAYYSLRVKYQAAPNSIIRLPSVSSQPRLVQDLINGFNTRGLFAFSRHPNFLAEMLLWATFAALSFSPQVSWDSYFSHPFSGFLGAFLLWCIFMGSTDFTEEISLTKYPAYTTYQKHVPRLIPNVLQLVNYALFQTLPPFPVVLKPFDATLVAETARIDANTPKKSSKESVDFIVASPLKPQARKQ